MGKKKKERIADTLVDYLNDSLFVLVDTIKKRFFSSLSKIIKNLQLKMIKKYCTLIVLSISGLVLAGIGISEMIANYMYSPLAYILVGAIFIIGGLVYKEI